jgi:hypothetical protein
MGTCTIEAVRETDLGKRLTTLGWRALAAKIVSGFVDIREHVSEMADQWTRLTPQMIGRYSTEWLDVAYRRVRGGAYQVGPAESPGRNGSEPLTPNSADGNAKVVGAAHGWAVRKKQIQLRDASDKTGSRPSIQHLHR